MPKKKETEKSDNKNIKISKEDQLHIENAKLKLQIYQTQIEKLEIQKQLVKQTFDFAQKEIQLFTEHTLKPKYKIDDSYVFDFSTLKFVKTNKN